MIATFCLRLAAGMIAALVVLPAKEVPPRFFRVQYLTALGLLVVAAFFLRELADLWLWLALGAGLAITFAGSVIWHLDGAPGQQLVLTLAIAALGSALILGGSGGHVDVDTSMSRLPGTLLYVDDLASAAVLGTAISAMLMGHSYLIAPTMTLAPLNRLLGALGIALLARISLACIGLTWWTARPYAGNLETEMILWLGVRWVIGLAGPLVLGWLAWETARIRSTQSATGILYVVVILCFLGELTSQLLLEKTGYIL